MQDNNLESMKFHIINGQSGNKNAKAHKEPEAAALLSNTISATPSRILAHFNTSYIKAMRHILIYIPCIIKYYSFLNAYHIINAYM